MKKTSYLLLAVLFCHCNALDPEIPKGQTSFAQDKLPSCSVEEMEKSGVHIRWKITIDSRLNTSLDQMLLYYAEEDELSGSTWQVLDLSPQFKNSNETNVTLSNLKPATAYHYQIYLANQFTEGYPAQSGFTTRNAAWVKVGEVPPVVHGRQVLKVANRIFMITDYTSVKNFSYLNPAMEHNQLWEYDPVKTEWKYITQTPFIGRFQFVCFGLGDQIFMGLGYRHTGIGRNMYSYVDWWCYDLKQNQWTRKKDFGGLKFNMMTFFSVQGKGYMLTGSKTNPQELPDYGRETMHLYEYDLLNDAWKEKAPFPGEKIVDGSSFVISNRAFVFAGTFGAYSYADESFTEYTPLYYVDDMWEYDCLNNRWFKRSSFGGGKRTQMATGVTVSNKGFAGCGLSEKDWTAEWPLDWWGYIPETDEWIAYPAPPFNPDFTFEHDGHIFIGKNDGELWKYAEW